MTTLAVAALSARMMAEAAVRDGFDVVALDLFGDVDTCEAASRWFAIGGAASMRIDATATLAALRVLAHRGDVLGWVAGSGFEGQPGLLAQGGALLPLVGNTPAVVTAVRDPARFFGVLDAHAIPHPAVRLQAPVDTAGWLLKDAAGCGGWHIRRAAPDAVAEAMPANHYYQREQRGVPMSATFVANGEEGVVLGFNEQIVRPFGDRPFVFCGVVGPVQLAPAVVGLVAGIVQQLAAAFGLRGLCSLDFLLDGDDVWVLEINPRPPASIALYSERGLMAAHVRASLHGELPAAPATPAKARVRGHEVVFARRRVVLDDRMTTRLAAWPGTHDLPCAGGRFEPGDPLCSLSASGADADQVRASLAHGGQGLLRSLET